jgi:hypothetical protein
LGKLAVHLSRASQWMAPVPESPRLMADSHIFLQKLIVKTETKRLPWRPSVESDGFTVSLDQEFVVTIRKTAPHEFFFEVRDQRDNQLFHLSAEKTHAWEQGYEEAVELYASLSRLHDAARFVALDVSKQLSRAEALLDKL